MDDLFFSFLFSFLCFLSSALLSSILFSSRPLPSLLSSFRLFWLLGSVLGLNTNRSLCSSFLKELEKCEDAPEKLAKVFLSAVSLDWSKETILQCSSVQTTRCFFDLLVFPHSVRQPAYNYFPLPSPRSFVDSSRCVLSRFCCPAHQPVFLGRSAGYVSM